MKRLKIVLTFALIGLSATVWGQDGTIDKGSGWLYFSGVPGTTPNVSCCAEIAMNVLTREAYVWNRDSTEWELLIELTQGLAAPSGDPGAGPKLFLNRDDGLLYRWTGAAWEAYGSGGALADGDYGHIDVSGTGTVMTVDTGVIGPTQLASTAVTPASYTLSGFTVDADGRITAAASGTIGSGTNGDMAVWSGANTLTSQTDAKFIYDNNLTYGNRSSGTNAIWLNDSTLASVAYTAGQFLIGGPSGEVTDTTAAGALSMMGGTSGSGASPQVAYWSGASTLTGHTNLLWDGTELSVGTTASAYTLSVGTGGVYVTPQSAAVTGVEGAGYWDSDAPNGMWWHDGTSFFAVPKSSATSFTGSSVLFADATTGRITQDNAGIFFDATNNILRINNTSGQNEKLQVSGDLRVRNAAGTGAGTIYLDATSTTKLKIYQGSGIRISAGDASTTQVAFDYGTTGMARVYMDGSVATARIEAMNHSGYGNGTVHFHASDPSDAVQNNVVVRGSNGPTTANSGGSLFLRPGSRGSSFFTDYNGIPGYVKLQTAADSNAAVVNPFYDAIYVPYIAAGIGKASISFSGSFEPTSNADFGGKVRIRDLPDSLYRYEIRADASGRLTRQEGAVVGAISTSTDGSGDVTVTHGMGTTPTAVLVTPTGTTAWIVSVHTIDGTTFKVRFYDAAGAAVTSTAVTATWLGKT